jgi:hypothetical protein
MTTRSLHRTPLRRRAFVLKTAEVVSGTTTDQETILTPTKGFRVRLTRLKVLQTVADGRHLSELHFGDAGNLITDPSKGIDILAVPNLGSDSTRTYLKNEGPRGLRGEVLSLRWRGTAPANGHKIMIEYAEES